MSIFDILAIIWTTIINVFRAMWVFLTDHPVIMVAVLVTAVISIVWSVLPDHNRN